MYCIVTCTCWALRNIGNNASACMYACVTYIDVLLVQLNDDTCVIHAYSVDVTFAD